MDSARAEQEKAALERIKLVRHPFILSMDRIEILSGELLIVMELADKSLHDSFEECLSQGLRGIPAHDLWGYVRDAAEALDHLNEKHHLQHLDIKPRNLFLVSGRVKVADFGLVKNLERSNSQQPAGRRDAAVCRSGDLLRQDLASTATSTAWPSSTPSCSPASGPSTARVRGAGPAAPQR